MILSLEEVSFSYDNQLVLDHVSVGLLENEFVAVFGPNGGGKTTLLKLILGFLRPSRGRVSLFGESPEKTRHHIGYVPQVLRFDKDFPTSVLEVVMMGALSRLSWYGAFPKGTKEKALASLERVGLAHKAQSSFGTLSGGEAQRALIARALLNDPKLLILDEPTASIDTQGERAVLELLVELNQNMTLLTVTHDLQTVVDKATRLWCVQKRVSSLQTSEVCEHFALGLYHTPLTQTHPLPLKGGKC
jgi:zinc transport system ATP-binding protein